MGQAVERSARTDVLIASLILAFTAVPTHVRPFSLESLVGVFGFDAADAVENVLGYIPLGIALRQHGPFRGIVFAGILSLVAETIQIFCVSRDPQAVDVATNVLGAGLGIWLAGRWNLLPERIAVTGTLAAASAAIAIAFVASGATVTAESVANQLAGWWEAPPWMTTNPRGALSNGTLEAYWSFDRLEDGMIADASVGHLNGRVVNSPVLAPGVLGSSILLNGTQWVDFGAPTALRLSGSMTLSAWIRPTDFPSDDAAIISSLAPGDHGYQLDLTVDQGPRTIGFKVKDGSGHLMARYGRTPIAVDRWYHVAGVYDASARTLDVYLNGRRDSGCLLGTVADHQEPSGGHVLVGARPQLTGYEYIGDIDDVRIQSRSLQPLEIEEEVAQAGYASEPATADDSTTSSAACAPVATEPPRIAGSLVSLGMLLVFACAGLVKRAAWLTAVSISICWMMGATASFWMSPAVALQPPWLPIIHLSLGAAIGLWVCARASTRRADS